MASVDGKTSIKIDELVNGSVISGTIDAGSGHLLLTTRGGAVIDAGPITKPFSAPWNSVSEYSNGDVVGYAGYLWKALNTNTNNPPALFNSLWTRLTGNDMSEWVERDAYFTGDSISESWELFWKTGTVVASLSSVLGEFETGLRSLKLSMSASSSQRVYYKEENLVYGGEEVVVTLRAKLLSPATEVTVLADLYQNDAEGTPTPFQGATVTASQEGAQTLTTSWTTYRFTMVAVNAKPRSIAHLYFQTGANGAIVLVDRVRIVKSTSPIFKAPDVQIFTTSGTWTKPIGAKTVEIEVLGGGGGGGGATAAAASQHSCGTGGGAGGYAWSKKLAIDITNTVTVTVGLAGTGVAGAVGNAGGASSFGAYTVTGGGGGGAFAGTNPNDFWIEPPIGGTATTGDLLVPGQGGGAANGDGVFGMGGRGANSKYGAGGRERAVGSSAQALVGYAASGYGAGGGGALETGITSVTRAGGNGSPGLVIVTTHFQ